MNYRIIEKDGKYFPQLYKKCSLYNWRSITHYGRLRTVTERILDLLEWSIERDSLQKANESIEKHRSGDYKIKIHKVI